MTFDPNLEIKGEILKKLINDEYNAKEKLGKRGVLSFLSRLWAKLTDNQDKLRIIETQKQARKILAREMNDFEVSLTALRLKLASAPDSVKNQENIKDVKNFYNNWKELEPSLINIKNKLNETQFKDKKELGVFTNRINEIHNLFVSLITTRIIKP